MPCGRHQLHPSWGCRLTLCTDLAAESSMLTPRLCSLQAMLLLVVVVLLFSRSLMSDSLWPHWLQHARLPCLSPTHRTCSNSCPSSWWCHPTISSSVFPFSSCLQSFPPSGSFLMIQRFTSDGWSIGASASASVLSMNIQDWFSLGLIGLMSLLSKGLSNNTVQKHQLFAAQPSL